MEKLISLANAFFAKLYVPADKQAHLLSGFIIAVLFTPSLGIYAIMVVIFIAYLKEHYDYMHRITHTPDIFDLVATVAGGVIGWALLA